MRADRLVNVVALVVGLISVFAVAFLALTLVPEDLGRLEFWGMLLSFFLAAGCLFALFLFGDRLSLPQYRLDRLGWPLRLFFLGGAFSLLLLGIILSLILIQAD